MLTGEQRQMFLATVCVAFLVAIAFYFSYAGANSSEPPLPRGAMPQYHKSQLRCCDSNKDGEGEANVSTDDKSRKAPTTQ
jgi:hypothetical protein